MRLATLPQKSRGRPSSIDCLIAAAIFAATLLFFSPVAGFEFLNFDDNLYITENPAVLTGLSWNGIVWAFTETHGGHWHPLSWIAHMVDVSLFGLNPAGHHLMNVFWHAVSAVLVFLLARRLPHVGFSIAASLAIAGLFAFHPQRIESVAWVTERKDVMSVCFTLLAIHAYLSFVCRAGLTATVAYSGILISYLLALLSKPSAVVVPALLLLLDWWPLRRDTQQGLRRMVIEKLPLIALAGAVSLAAVHAQHDGGGLKSLAAYPIDARVANVLVGFSVYLGKFFFPTGQGIFFPFELYQSGPASGAAVLLILISALCWMYRRSAPGVACGWVWFLVSLLPVIGLVQIGGQSYADRWSYLPSIGLLLGCGELLRCLLKSYPTTYRRALTVGVPAVCAIAMVLTWRQLPHWRSSETLFRHTLSVAPENFMAEMQLGLALSQQGRYAEALPHFERAALLSPGYPPALNNFGIALIRAGRVGEAEIHFRRTLAVAPDHWGARLNLVRLLREHGYPGAALNESAPLIAVADKNSDVAEELLALARTPCSTLSSWSPSPAFRAALEDQRLNRRKDIQHALQTLLHCGR